MVSKDKTTITFHSGILTIGGTVIEVAYKDSHIFFDFGTEFLPKLELTDESVQTLVNHRVIPHLKNVYDARIPYKYEGDEDKDYANTAVFISHAHLDHTRMLNYLDPNIPLYTLKETKIIVNSLNRNGVFLIPSTFAEETFTRDMIGLDAGDVVKVGEIEVEIVRVDHDAYGAAALIIKTPGHHITYTGDLRLHGHNAEDTIEFCKKAKHTDILMMEGVSISFGDRPVEVEAFKPETEEDVIRQIVFLEQENPQRQITFNGYPANVRRFEKIVEGTNRIVVLEATMAALLKEVFQKEAHFYYREGAPRLDELDPNLEISYETLLEDTSEYLWQVVDHFERLQEGSLYIHSDAQPLGDFDPNYQPFLDLLAKKNIEFVRLACSGHAKPEDLDRIIAMIEPKCLIPIHTLKPELMENPYGKRILPYRGEKIML